MLSYQHAYHAGNLADVHKHAALAWVLEYLTRKDKPLSYIETHAGRGLYDLGSAEALKTGEAAGGIGRMEGFLPAGHPYLRLLAQARARFGPRSYPGSPLLAAMALREIDSIHLAELHPQELAALKATMAPWGAHVHHRDGMETALALTPPTPRRGVMLIDPAWEVKTEYASIPKAMLEVLRKWNVGILMLWYPLLDSNIHAQMIDALEKIPNGLRHEIRFPPARPGHRMLGSGLFVVNPPWGLDAALADIAQAIAKAT